MRDAIAKAGGPYEELMALIRQVASGPLFTDIRLARERRGICSPPGTCDERTSGHANQQVSQPGW